MRGDVFFLDIWKRNTPGFAGILLSPLSAIYGFIVRLRNYLYDKKCLPIYQLPCPVISVGNLTVGGTGKTPMTILISRIIKEAGFRPAVVSRGYKGKGGEKVKIVSTEKEVLLPPEIAGDEPVMMAKKLRGIPVITGKDRVQAGRQAWRRFYPDCIVCDDAFQHRRLHRDLDILLLNAHRPFGNGRLLPAGPLREPKTSVSRAHLIGAIKKGADTTAPDICPAFTARMVKTALFLPTTEEKRLPKILRGKRVFAFAGIADPEHFLHLLKEEEAEVVRFLAFPDHYGYTKKDVEQLRETALSERCEFTCTTEKDAVKIAHLTSVIPNLAVLQVEIEIEENFETFRKHVLTLIEKCARQKP
ncbi:MAG: tetraacyldisaccharide 4'-kinase [Syntrophales bacterium]|nr:tetraacyldisaccharide 4'-kinase [Syntrophales bacterium]